MLHVKAISIFWVVFKRKQLMNRKRRLSSCIIFVNIHYPKLFDYTTWILHRLYVTTAIVAAAIC